MPLMHRQALNVIQRVTVNTFINSLPACDVLGIQPQSTSDDTYPDLTSTYLMYVLHACPHCTNLLFGCPPNLTQPAPLYAWWEPIERVHFLDLPLDSLDDIDKLYSHLKRVTWVSTLSKTTIIVESISLVAFAIFEIFHVFFVISNATGTKCLCQLKIWTRWA